MPPPRTTPKWPSSRFSHGYCEPFRSTPTSALRVRFRYKTRQKVTELLWIERNQTRAVRALDIWIGQIQSGKLPAPTAKPARSTITHIGQAIEAFTQQKLRRSSKAVYTNHTQAFKAFFPVPVRLDAETLERYLPEQLAALEKRLAHNTVAKHCQLVRRLLGFCVRRGWIARDPMEDLDTPTQQKKEAVITYSPEDFIRILEYFHNKSRTTVRGSYGMNPRERYEQYNLLWLLLAATGMRISEALALRWYREVETEAYISPSQIHIRGKGSKWRNFPLTGKSLQVERVRMIILQLRQYDNQGYVFPWRARTGIATQLGKALAALGIDGGNRPVHAMRATAEKLWQSEQVDPLVMTRLLGHSLRVYEQHYQGEVEAAQIAKALELP